ncbi:glutamate-cysteine ligase family protein [Actinoplanes sp. CA-030573]|uniref:glutamate-cysteine ligase family protein n=1 Tax=Actinoplanes sp. CA-030573 TaxID=3239898 RepID=UPI003D8B5B98
MTTPTFAPAPPGFVGAAVDVPGRPGLSGRVPLPHGFLKARSSSVAVVSGPPSPGLAVCLDRMGEDLARAGAGSFATPDPGAGILVGLEAGLEGGGVLGRASRWRRAHVLAPVLAAAFAGTPSAGWRSTRQSTRRDLPVAATARQAPGAPVSAHGHLEIDVADHQPAGGWRLPIAVVTTLMDDPRAAADALRATAHLESEPRLWERAARDALTDPVLAAAARECFLAAYAALARHGADRALRDALAAFTERYVLRSRCPADDLLANSPRS